MVHLLMGAMNKRLLCYWVATVAIALETLAGGATDLLRGRAALVFGPYVLDTLNHLG
ncbi:MAG TPA: hypothetical protein VJO33_10460 [Gemmatimonadaceae bacterium]|nr:hypothetical protein [Gemmatimonadaceae bacterium]